MQKLLTGNSAAAWGARLARAEVIPNYPVTPQTEIIETIAEWDANGEMDTQFVPMESEHSVMSASISASASGARVFTASSSQGTLLMHEVMYIASGLRLPIVMVNVSRGVSAPITLWPDHNDILGLRDAGWLQFHCQNNQEVLDTIIQAYKIAEDKKVLLPILINLDGFVLSFTREPISIPEPEKVDSFLPKFNPTDNVLDPKNPASMGSAVFGDYMYFRNQHHLASMNALKITRQVEKEFAKKFGRKYSCVEWYGNPNAKYVLVTTNSMSTVARSAIEGTKDCAVLRIRMLRPFPEKEIKKQLDGAKAVGVVDQNVAPGYGGIIYPEIRSALFGTRTKVVSSFIAGLGGRNLTKAHFVHMFKMMKAQKESKTEWIY